MHMKITLTDSQSTLSLSHEMVEKSVSAILQKRKVQTDEVLIHLVDKEEICQIHRDFFDDPSPTDCISFPMDNPSEEACGYSILGEIFVCPEVAIEYTRENGGDPIRETMLYIVHGLLHLLGYDDIEDKDRLEMRHQEELCMKLLYAD